MIVSGVGMRGGGWRGFSPTHDPFEMRLARAELSLTTICLITPSESWCCSGWPDHRASDLVFSANALFFKHEYM